MESLEVVLTAVQHTGMALCYASHTLQDDIEAHQTWQSMTCVDGQVWVDGGGPQGIAGHFHTHLVLRYRRGGWSGLYECSLAFALHFMLRYLRGGTGVD